YNADGYIDEYDLYVKQFDGNGDRKLTKAEFTNSSNGKLYDDNLFSLIDNLNGPMFAGDPPRAGLADNLVDNRDGYAKVRGTISLAVTADQWIAKGYSIWDWIQGPVVPTDPGAPPIKFGVAASDMLDLSPSNFDQCAINFHNQIKISGNDPPAMTTVPAQGSTV